ncbi:MAG: hypothetical protein M3Y87_01025 [Myxococcota bacterium]|nr:hypothetical protein [Myxococcota bacterium]
MTSRTPLHAFLVALAVSGCSLVLDTTNFIGSTDAAVTDGGGVDSGDLDSGDLDSSIPDDAVSSPPITIVVTRSSEVVADLRVLFHDDAGDLLEALTTDASGQVTSSAPGVAGATIFDPSSGAGQLELFTVVGLLPRDTIEFELTQSADAVRGVEVTPPGPFAGATEYRLQSYCAAEMLVDPTAPFITCGVGNYTPLLVTAYMGGEVVAHSALFATGELSAVTLPPWETSFVSIPVAVTATAPESVRVEATLLDRGFGARVSPVVNGSATELAILNGLERDVLISASGSRLVGGMEVSVQVRTLFLPDMLSTSAFAADLDSVPPLTAFALDRTDPARPGVSWTGVPTTGVHAEFRYLHEAQAVSWRVFAPPGSSRIALPELSSDLADLRPSTEAPSVLLELVSGASFSWAAMRSRPLLHWSNRTSRMATTAAGGMF